MNPKPVRQIISLKAHAHGLAGHYKWEKEVLIDYISDRFGYLADEVKENAKYGLCSETDYLEMLAIAKAVRKHAGVGMSAKIELTGVFNDLRDFVEWSKEELADYLVYQIVECRLSSLFMDDECVRRLADELSELAFAVLYNTSPELADEADENAEQYRRFRDMQQASQEEADARAKAAHAQVDARQAARRRNSAA